MRSPKFVRFFVLIAGLIVTLGHGDLAQASVEGTIRPKRLAVYYGTPSRVNTAYGNAKVAAKVFAEYDVKVFNQGLEEQNHGDHARTKQIISILHRDYDTKVFGYLDGVAWKSSWSLTGIPEANWNAHVEMWREMGADGIFVDRCRVPSHIRSTDMYLLESFVIIEGRYDVCHQSHGDSWIEKADKAFAYHQTFGSEMWAMTTADQLGAGGGSPAETEAKLEYAWYAATMYGFDGFGWAEPQFSASGSSLNRLPWRPRPNPNMPDGVGATFLDEMQHISNVHTRSTDIGRLQVVCEDGGRHEAAFCSLGRYDMNGDGIVDLDDVHAVLSVSIYYNAPYDPAFDFVPDGVIDIADIADVALYFGESC